MKIHIEQAYGCNHQIKLKKHEQCNVWLCFESLNYFYKNKLFHHCYRQQQDYHYIQLETMAIDWFLWCCSNLNLDQILG